MKRNYESVNYKALFCHETDSIVYGIINQFFVHSLMFM